MKRGMFDINLDSRKVKWGIIIGSSILVLALVIIGVYFLFFNKGNDGESGRRFEDLDIIDGREPYYPNKQYLDYEGVIIDGGELLEDEEVDTPIATVELYEYGEAEIVEYVKKGSYGELVYRESPESEPEVVKILPGVAVYDATLEKTIMPSELNPSTKALFIFENEGVFDGSERKLSVVIVDPTPNTQFLLLDTLSANEEYYIFQDSLTEKTYYYRKENHIRYVTNGMHYDIDDIQVGDRFIGYLSDETYSESESLEDSQSSSVLDSLYIIPKRNY